MTDTVVRTTSEPELQIAMQRIAPEPDISHNVIESLVLESTNVDNAPHVSPAPTPAPEATTLLSRLFGTGARNVTTRRPVSPNPGSSEGEPILPSDRQTLLQLRLDTETTELMLKKAMAEKALAVTNRDIKLVTMETLELDLQISQAQARTPRSGRSSLHSGSPVLAGATSPLAPSATSPTLRPRSPDSTGGFSVRALMEQMQQLADDRRQQADERADIRRLEAESRAEAHRRHNRLDAWTRAGTTHDVDTVATHWQSNIDYNT